MNYDLCDPLNKPRKFKTFELNSHFVVHDIVRLLIGNVDLKHKKLGKKLRLGRNELRFPISRSSNPRYVCNLLFNGDINISEYERFVLSASRDNILFFKNVLEELKLCMIARKNGRYTESFLYIYRILEYVSVALPVFYASAQKDFSQSYKFLKQILNDEKSSELKVLENALPLIVKGEPLEQMVFNFSAINQTKDYLETICKEFDKKICQYVEGMTFDCDDETIFSVPFRSMSKFIVTVRNRSFHFNFGQPNLDLVRLGGSEKIISIVIDEILYWFSLVFAEILRILSRRYI